MKSNNNNNNNNKGQQLFSDAFQSVIFKTKRLNINENKNYSDYAEKLRESEKTRDAIQDAALQAEAASIMAREAVKPFAFCFPRKRKNKNLTPNTKATKRSKKSKYNLTVRTNFKDWKDFTNYIRNEAKNIKR